MLSTPNDSQHITALRLYGHEDLRVEHTPRQICEDDAVRIQIAYCGICGSDLHEFQGPVLCPSPGQCNPLTGCSLPVTLGHEMSGTISGVGKNVSELCIGDRVTVNPAIVERTMGLPSCVDCESGFPNSCSRATCYGLGGPGGGFADEIVVKADNVFKLPDSVSLQEGALTEPLAVAWHSVRTSQFQKGQNVLVLGAGPIGLAILQVLRFCDARNIIVSDVLEFRKEMALSLGASAVADPLKDPDSIDDIVRKLCGEGGVDIAFDTSGLQSTFDTAISCVKARGTVFNVAIHEKPLLFNPTRLSLQEKILRGGNGYTKDDFLAVLDALSTRTLKVDQLITAVVPLRRVVEEGFGELLAKRGNHIKILVQPECPDIVRPPGISVL